jgi:AcrR family transcriptional regulator
VTGEHRRTSGGRAALLQRAVDHFAEHGVGDTSVRALAEQIGTSHRMLLYHFGSREGLLAAVVDQVEAAARATLATQRADADPSADPVEQGMRFWATITEQALVYGPLFFELTSHAMQGRPHADALRDRLVTPWIEAAAEAWVALGVTPEVARVRARLDLAVTRGLLHDLLLTGDREAVDAVMRDYADTIVASRTTGTRPRRPARQPQRGRNR